MRLYSMTLADGRRVTIYMPASASARPRRRYPLLVLHDGQNVFEPDRAFARSLYWRAGEIADELIATGRIPPLVVCGIDHAGPDRIREFTPTAGPDGKGGGASGYLRLIVEELLPLLRREFPVRRDRASTGLGGSSLGGLATLVAAVEYPAVFGSLLVMSPSVWWDRRVVLRMIAGRAAALAGARMWLDIGLREGPKAVADVRRLARRLESLPVPRSAERLALRYVEDPEGDHSEKSWAARLPRALEFLTSPLDTRFPQR